MEFFNKFHFYFNKLNISIINVHFKFLQFLQKKKYFLFLFKCFQNYRFNLCQFIYEINLIKKYEIKYHL